MHEITIHTEEDIRCMRVAGRLAAEVLDFIAPHVRPGVTTARLDRLCHDYMVDVQGTIPAPLNYAPNGHTPYPKSICTSVNHVICHGIPDGYVLRDGDIVNIDVTVIKDGYHGDTSRMFHVGRPSAAARKLCQVTYECMWMGISRVRPGVYLGDIGFAIQQHAERHGYGVVREFCGHGIGKVFHAQPYVFHHGVPGTCEMLVPGMIFTIEPMLNLGGPHWSRMPDGWTIVTKDRSLSAQWEHTLVVTETGYEIMTLSAGTPAAPHLPEDRIFDKHGALVRLS
jgi:methionyl aminopeptidase